MSTTFGGRVFDRVVQFDPRSLAYDVRAQLAASPSAYDKVQDALISDALKRIAVLEGKTPTPPKPAPTPTPVPPKPKPVDVLYAVPQWLDQQQTGMCVGYGWSDDAQSSPHPDTIIAGHGGDDPTSTPAAIYFLAQKLDGQPADDQAGTSVLAGAKAAKQLGFIKSYNWALTITDAVAALATLGPVVFGLNWYEKMMDVDTNGFIHPSGNVVGGHCILGRGVSADRTKVLLRNSWGQSWGVNGDAWINVTDLGLLLGQQGECAVPSK